MTKESKKTNLQNRAKNNIERSKEQIPKPPSELNEEAKSKEKFEGQKKNNRSNSRTDAESCGGGFDGLILIIIGAYILLVNLGYIDWLEFFKLAKFWPLILVYWGLKLLVKNKIVWRIISILISLLIIGLLIIQFSGSNLQNFLKDNFNITAPGLMGTRNRDESTYKLEQSFLENVEARNISLEITLGKVIVEDNSTSVGFEMAADQLEMLGKPQVTETVNDNQLAITVSTQVDGTAWPRIGSSQAAPNYNFNYGVSELPTSLNLNLELGSAAVNLNTVRHRIINFNNNLGSTEASIGPEALPGELNLRTGMGSIQLILPEEVNLIVNYKVGIGRLDVDGESLSGEGVYQSQTQENQPDLPIQAEVGIGSIRIERN